MDYLLLLVGFAVLMGGGEFLVRGAAGLALKAKIDPLVVGLTVVSLGTSAPEMLVSIQAALDGNPDISVGNVVGSNIANLGLVLGITSIIFPIKVDRNIIRQDWPMMMAASLTFFIFALDGELSFLEGLILFITLIFFTVYLLFRSKWQNKPVEEVQDLSGQAKKSYWLLFGLVLIGCVGLNFGSQWFVDAAKNIAKSYGVSDHIIGVTLVAFGTSVPELAASGIAAFRKQSDIAIGNLIGSNIFNILAVLGITSMIQNLSIADTIMSNDIFWMLAIAFALGPIMFIRSRISRVNGVILLSSYVAYILFLVSSI